jgi:hypothetical protein
MRATRAALAEWQPPGTEQWEFKFPAVSPPEGSAQLLHALREKFKLHEVLLNINGK